MGFRLDQLTTLRLSNSKLVVKVRINAFGTIMYAAPVICKFYHTHIDRLKTWMARAGEVVTVTEIGNGNDS